MAGILTIQGVLAASEEDVPSGMSELINKLASKLAEIESEEGL